MQTIATAAGVNKALLHYYYRNKNRLHEKVREDTVGTVWGRLQLEFRRQEGGQKGEQRLEPLVRAAVSTYVHTISENPDFPLFMVREIAGGGDSLPAALPGLIRRFSEVPNTLTRSLHAEIKARKIKPILPVHFFLNMMGMTVATFLALPMLRKMGPALGFKLELEDAFLEARIQSITDTLLNGIRIKR